MTSEFGKDEIVFQKRHDIGEDGDAGKEGQIRVVPPEQFGREKIAQGSRRAVVVKKTIYPLMKNPVRHRQFRSDFMVVDYQDIHPQSFRLKDSIIGDNAVIDKYQKTISLFMKLWQPRNVKAIALDVSARDKKANFRTA